MSNRIDEFSAALREQLRALEERTISLKASLQAASDYTKESVRTNLDEAERKVESQKRAVAKAKSSVQSWFEQKADAAKATVDRWQANHEAKRLADHADMAEAHAAAAILLAQSSIDEAEHAVFEAIAARLEADAVEVA